MLKWVVLILLWGPFSWAADVCEDAVTANITACHGDLVDPAFQRSHKTSPRTHALVYNLSQSCVNNIAHCFDKCGDSRFRDGDKFKEVLKILRGSLGEKLVSRKTVKCRENLNTYAKKIVQICEKFKVHQSAAAQVDDAQQRILSEHCSQFSNYLQPLPDEDKKDQGVGKASTKKDKAKKKPLVQKREETLQNLKVGSVSVGDGLVSGSSVSSSEDGELNPKGLDSGVPPSVGGGFVPERRKGAPAPLAQRNGNPSEKGQGFVGSSTNNFQPLNSPGKKKKARRARGSSLNKQKEKIGGNSYHVSPSVPDPGAGQAVPASASPGPAVSASVVQDLQKRLMKKVMGKEYEESQAAEAVDKRPPEVFNDTKRTFRKFRRNNEFIE